MVILALALTGCSATHEDAIIVGVDISKRAFVVELTDGDIIYVYGSDLEELYGSGKYAVGDVVDVSCVANICDIAE